MKFSYFFIAMLLCSALISCSNDDEPTGSLEGQTGTLVVKFDNGVGDQDFIFGTTYTKSGGESYELETLKYIVSNIELTAADGTTFMYPEAKNVFIIDEADGNNAGEIWLTLDDVPAADYTKISFGIGIDQERYSKGAEGQGDFLQQAQDEEMLWSWATGFRFVRLDGVYSDATLTDEALNVHMGSVGTSLDNYREVGLDLPNSVLVRETANPQIHIKADIAKVFDGQTSVKFSEGFSQVHTDEATTPVIADNMMGMFTVHHVHNN
ncbi:MbnP family protein [Pareuzebyella sediminis]|uniref:MbnP family protein n=1 Tax=Pareuzebyella sediminis TaxID=2607998 RepID=UPI0011EF6935|nr:MbnP family protein [Pareuzebyella sediminis]